MIGKKRERSEIISDNFKTSKKIQSEESIKKANPSGRKYPKTAAHLAFGISFIPSGRVYCRDKQLDEVFKFCSRNTYKQTPGSLYISGSPGTGKTLTVQIVLDRLIAWQRSLEEQKNIYIPETRLVKVNCMQVVGGPDKIFSHITAELGLKPKTTQMEQVSSIERFICSKDDDRMTILVLDEMDQLVTRNRDILYKLFRWPHLPNSKLLVIGIANALDMTHRLLPKLPEAQQPCTITFPVYAKDDVSTVLKQRLDSVDGEVISPPALELCCRTVSFNSGDVRKALDVCRVAVSTAKTLPVGIKEMKTTLTSVFGSSKATTIRALPQHHTLTLCAAIRMLRGSVKDFDVKELYNSYQRLLGAHSLQPTTWSEFRDGFSCLKESGLLRLTQSKRPAAKCRYTCHFTEEDFTEQLKDSRFYQNILTPNSQPAADSDSDEGEFTVFDL